MSYRNKWLLGVFGVQGVMEYFGKNKEVFLCHKSEQPGRRRMNASRKQSYNRFKH